MESKKEDNDRSSTQHQQLQQLPYRHELKQNSVLTTTATESTTTTSINANIPTASDTALCESIRHDHDLRVPYYCEENVWRLAYRKLYYYQIQRNEQIRNETKESKLLPLPLSMNNNEVINNFERYYVVYISNEQKCVPMYHQRAASAVSSSVRKNEKPCCFWDYHVILIGATDSITGGNNDTGENNDKRILVYDIDTTIVPYPVPLHQYISLSFLSEYYSSQNHNSQYLQYKPLFRIIPAETYIQYFTSDRSHMFNEMTQLYNEPPPPYSCIVVSPSTDNSTIPTTESVGGTVTEKYSVENSGLIRCNFQKYLDFTTILKGEYIDASPYGAIVTLEQLLQYDF